MTTQQERFLGAMFGLAYGDAIGFPALFHRFRPTPKKRHDFLWRTNMETYRQNISRLMLPFTHRLPSEMLEPSPTDDTEFAMLTLRAILNDPDEPTRQTFLAVWQDEVVPAADEVFSSFSERAAIENLKRGLLPPVTGNDNPLHYEDSAAPRAVPVGLYCAGDPDRAAEVAQFDAEITQAEDGIYAARAMAAAIAVLAGGGALPGALARARQEFPAGSWIAHVDSAAQTCLQDAQTVEDLVLSLSTTVINTVYSYGSLAPETLPAALAVVEKCGGDLRTACLQANTIAKSADSLPALVGALCGCYQGAGVLGAGWRAALAVCRGLCLPFLKDAGIEAYTLQLFRRVQAHP
ncbi:MAG: ADP-ribosylglycohydrolase family protein [Anaerolineae bacterium]|nr:ADP-ribosylglycohydrolase family protein [Anaerolineae bacterium]